jgi:hypothetical protein
MKFPYRAFHIAKTKVIIWSTEDAIPIKHGVLEKTEHREVKVLAHSPCNTYAMVRRPRAMPYVAAMDEIEATE